MMYLSLLKGRVMWAALAVVAMGVVLGGLTASDVSVHAQERVCNDSGASAPIFDANGFTRSVDENTPPGVNIGNPISATDPDEATEEYGDTLTYSLAPSASTADARAEAAAFDIDASTGQLITKAPLDRESNPSYLVKVEVEDSTGNCVSQEVDITVEGEPELPLAPTRPTVVSSDDATTANTDESSTRLKVIWHPPDNAGRPRIAGYDVQYKESTETEFTNHTHSGTKTSATITVPKADTSYDVRVRANGDGDGPWSLVGTGSTNKENNKPPRFTITRSTDCTTDICESMPENESPGQNVTSKLTVSDPNSLDISWTYRLGGPDADSFDFDTSSHRIRTKRGVTYDLESKSSYGLTVTVFDGHGGSDAIGVKITLTNEEEPPAAPTRPTVRPTEKSSTSLDVSWNAPENTGRPDITGYIVHYREGSTGTFMETPQLDDGDVHTTKTSFTIGSLNAGTSYQVQVRAVNDEGSGPWSILGTGKTSTANREPEFGDDTLTRQVDENTLSNTRTGQNVGARVSADQDDSDKLTYTLAGNGLGFFQNQHVDRATDHEGVPGRGYEGRILGDCGGPGRLEPAQGP